MLVMKEGDIKSREIIVTIIDNGQPFDITNHLVKFKWHKPDHTYIFNDCNITENGKALINCTEQMLIVGGIAKVEVILYDDSDAKTVLSTMEFDVSIRNSVISNTDIESTDEFGALNNLILSNKDLNESLKQLGDDTNEPIADTVRGILDGHIVLSRALANSNHFPAIDVGASISRLMVEIVSPEHRKLAGELRDIMGVYEKNADLVSIGAYKAGTNPKLDHALTKMDAINQFLMQGTDEAFSYEESLAEMERILR